MRANFVGYSFDMTNERPRRSSQSQMENKNVSWLDSTGSYMFYLVVVFMMSYFFSMVLPLDYVWTATHVFHGLTTFHAFHWMKGSPDESTQGVFNALTFFEQLDDGRPWTSNKKFLMVIPALLCLIASASTDYSPTHLAINIPVFLLTILPKIPEMHRVRIFGINSTVGIDDASAKERGFMRRLHSE